MQVTHPWLIVPEDRTICHHYRERDPLSLDFLACEGGSGWPATHTMVPFATMIFVGNFVAAWLGTGLIEVAEALGLMIVGAAYIGRVRSDQLETLAGSVLGDWAMNDLLGVLAAFILLRLYGIPGMLQPWYHSSFCRPLGTRVGREEEQVVTFEDDQKPRRQLWPRVCGRYWWKQHLAMVLYLAVGFLPMLVLPRGCDVFVPYACVNVGVMISVGWQLLLIALFATVWMRTEEDERFLWRPAGLSQRQVSAFFLLWALFVAMVGMQAWQPWMPLWFIPRMAEWAQGWLFAWLWIGLVILLRFTVWRRR